MKLLSSFRLSAAAFLVAGFAIAPDANAQIIATSSYFVQHNFFIFPGGNLLPSVRGRWYDHAWVREPGRAVAQVNPVVQPGVWGPFARDWLVFGGLVFNGGGVFANRGTAVFGAGGGARVDTATVPPGPSQAFARSTIVVNPYGPGGPVSGFVRSDGFAQAFVPFGGRAEAWSFSTATVEVRGRRWFFGRILWGPTIRDTVSGSASARAERRRDPIVVRVRDNAGNVTLESNLLEIDTQLHGDGEMNFENGQMFIGAPGADFKVNMTSPFTLQQGTIDLQVRDGTVVVSESTGVFAGMIPPVGTPVPIVFTMPPQIEIDYQLPQGPAEDVEFDMGGGSNDLPICPADFNNDGAVDFFDYLDFVAAFDVGDPSADFNGDGATDFFDYLDFVAALDAGC
jgi:hypothetical protein